MTASAPPLHQSSSPALLGALAVTVALYAGTFVVVRDYYVTHLPHYDSIGSYTVMFDVMNTARRDGLAAAMAEGARSSISWLHPGYALLLAWLPVRTPEILVSLNFLLLFIGQAAIIGCLRTLGAGPLRQFAVAMLPLLPGIVYVWDGGLQDLRRDPQTNLLLTAILFLSIAYVLRSSPARAIGLGVLLALCQWSRDNALAMMAISLGPALVLVLAGGGAVQRARALVRLGWMPLGVFLLLAGPYYALTLEITIFRYTHVVWGVGEDRVASLLGWWRAPVDAFLAGHGRYNGNPRLATLTAGVMAGGGLVVAALTAVGALRVRPRRCLQWPGAILTLGGLSIVVAVVLYNTVVIGYGPRWHGMPFAAVVGGSTAILAGLMMAFEASRTPVAARRWLVAAVVAGAIALVPAGLYRMHVARFPPVGAGGVRAVREAVASIAEVAADRSLAVLWFDGFSRHHLNYFLTQQGHRRLVDFASRASQLGQYIDLEQPLRSGADPGTLQALLDATLRRYADFVLLSPETERYANANAILWPMRLGRPVVERLLTDPGFEAVASFELPPGRFVLLNNRLPQNP